MIYLIKSRTLKSRVNNYLRLLENFRQEEVVPSHEFIYYLDNYSKLYQGEDFSCYTIKHNFNSIGTLIYARLKDMIVVDYLVIDKPYRKFFRQIANKILSFLRKYQLPIVIEAETEELCRVYGFFGFRKFKCDHRYYMLSICLQDKTSVVSDYASNLLYFPTSSRQNYYSICSSLYKNHYCRWYDIYPKCLTSKYKHQLTKRLEEIRSSSLTLYMRND